MQYTLILKLGLYGPTWHLSVYWILSLVTIQGEETNLKFAGSIEHNILRRRKNSSHIEDIEEFFQPEILCEANLRVRSTLYLLMCSACWNN